MGKEKDDRAKDSVKRKHEEEGRSLQQRRKRRKRKKSKSLFLHEPIFGASPARMFSFCVVTYACISFSRHAVVDYIVEVLRHTNLSISPHRRYSTRQDLHL